MSSRFGSVPVGPPRGALIGVWPDVRAAALAGLGGGTEEGNQPAARVPDPMAAEIEGVIEEPAVPVDGASLRRRSRKADRPGTAGLEEGLLVLRPVRTSSGEAPQRPKRLRERRQPEPFSPDAKVRAGQPRGGGGGGAARRAEREKKPRRHKGAYERLCDRVRRLLSSIRQEQALVDAYEADGWRGAAREKVKPVAEIERAKVAMRRYRAELREAVKYCDNAEGDTPIPLEKFEPGGEVKEEHIFCAKCGSNQDEEGNDIVLCDGEGCTKAYHCKCVDPPLDLSALGEDEGWLCPSCDAKLDILEEINDEFGTEYNLKTPWQEVLPDEEESVTTDEAQTTGTLGAFLGDADLPSEDEGDENYDGGSGSASASSSESDSHPSDEERGSDDEGIAPGEDTKVGDEAGRLGSVSPESPPVAVLEGKRRRANVDYRALHLEMFGTAEADPEEDGEASVDEPWSPSPPFSPKPSTDITSKRRRRAGTE